jgi:hypothetical protein
VLADQLYRAHRTKQQRTALIPTRPNSGGEPTALATASIDGLQRSRAIGTPLIRRRFRRPRTRALLGQGTTPTTAFALQRQATQLRFEAFVRDAAYASKRTLLREAGAMRKIATKHERATDSWRRYNVEVTRAQEQVRRERSDRADALGRRR